MRPSKPALPEWARPQDLAPTVENARRLGLPQAARPEAQHGSPTPSTTQQPAEPSWGQRLNRNMRQWGEGVIDRLDEAAVADGGGLVTALAALARTPARSFTSFMQGTAGTVSLLDGRVRGEISDGLSQVMSDPGLIGRAASDYWRSRTLADMAADLYANGAAGAMMGGLEPQHLGGSIACRGWRRWQMPLPMQNRRRHGCGRLGVFILAGRYRQKQLNCSEQQRNP